MMRTPVSWNRCAEYLGVSRDDVKAAIEAGVVRYGTGEGKVIPADVLNKLVMAGTCTHCPCCGADMRPDDEEGA